MTVEDTFDRLSSGSLRTVLEYYENIEDRLPEEVQQNLKERFIASIINAQAVHGRD